MVENNLIHQRQIQEEHNLMILADNMAAAAANFNSHGYDIFLQARDEFMRALHESFEHRNLS